MMSFCSQRGEGVKKGPKNAVNVRPLVGWGLIKIKTIFKKQFKNIFSIKKAEYKTELF